MLEHIDGIHEVEPTIGEHGECMAVVLEQGHVAQAAQTMSSQVDHLTGDVDPAGTGDQRCDLLKDPSRPAPNFQHNSIAEPWPINSFQDVLQIRKS